jgi:hypothetical protein
MGGGTKGARKAIRREKERERKQGKVPRASPLTSF